MFLFHLLLATKFLLMSDRADFWDPDTASAKTQQMGKQETNPLPIDFRAFKGQKVLVLAHGFNNSAKDVIETYQQINNAISSLTTLSGKPLYDIVLGYLWPGGDSRLEYFSASARADLLADRVGSHLNALAFFADTVDIFAHSMGNRLMLGALDQLTIQNEEDHTRISEKKAFQWDQSLNNAPWSFVQWLSDTIFRQLYRNKLSQKPIQNFYSLAAAIDAEALEKDQPYYNATQQCENMYVFHSNRDDVLKFLFLIAEKDEALGYKGIGDLATSSQNIQYIDCTSLVPSHSGYFALPSLYQFIRNQHIQKILTAQISPNVKLLDNGLVEAIVSQAEFMK